MLSRRLCAAMTVAVTTWLGGPVAEAAPRRAAPAAMLPPPRPAEFGQNREEWDNLVTGSLAAGAMPAGRAAAPLPLHRVAADPKLDQATIVTRANAALNAIASMTADFTQVNGDGRKATGTLYFQRPGKVRFEYDKPSTLEVVSDGSTVLVRDRKLNTADPYPVGQTPLKFLLAARIDLARDSTIQGVSSDEGAVRVQIEDRATLGGTSRITLSFNPEVTELRGWKVIDPQGYATTVVLADIEKNRTIDPRIFMLNYMRPVE